MVSKNENDTDRALMKQEHSEPPQESCPRPPTLSCQDHDWRHGGFDHFRLEQHLKLLYLL